MSEQVDTTLPEQTFNSLRLFLAPATLTTGALYYFGWVRTRAVARYFGIDPELLGYSTTDYILRSVSTVFPLLVVVAGLVLLGRRIYSRSLSELTDLSGVKELGVRVERNGKRLAAVGFVLLAFFQQLLAVSSALAVIGPLAAIPGIAMIAIGARLQTAVAVTSSGQLVGSTGLPAIKAIPLGMISVAAFFTVIFLSANAVGTLTAVTRARNLPDEPRVVLTSQTELHLFGTHVGELLTDNGSVSAPWSRQYRDLRLWVEANDRWFFVPADWRTNKVVHVVEIDGTVRLDIDERGS